jgi:hypothetical protein
VIYLSLYVLTLKPVAFAVQDEVCQGSGSKREPLRKIFPVNPNEGGRILIDLLRLLGGGHHNN